MESRFFICAASESLKATNQFLADIFFPTCTCINPAYCAGIGQLELLMRCVCLIGFGRKTASQSLLSGRNLSECGCDEKIMHGYLAISL